MTRFSEGCKQALWKWSETHHISQRRKNLLWTWKGKRDLRWFLNAGWDMVGRKKRRLYRDRERESEQRHSERQNEKKCYWVTYDFVKPAWLYCLIGFLFEASGQEARVYLRGFHGRGETQSGPWKTMGFDFVEQRHHAVREHGYPRTKWETRTESSCQGNGTHNVRYIKTLGPLRTH